MGIVLIIDDEHEIGLEMLDCVEALGHTAYFFQNPIHGFTFLKETEVVVDFVFVDMMMPEMDGKTFIRHAKKITVPSTRFYLMSGVPEREMLISPSLRGLVFLQKPISFERIEACLA